MVTRLPIFGNPVTKIGLVNWAPATPKPAYNWTAYKWNTTVFECYLGAKHTKDSKDSHLSRAFLPINLCWVRGSL
jgi:hypothetical protein